MTKSELLKKIDELVDKFDNMTDKELHEDHKEYFGTECEKPLAYKFGLLLGALMSLRHEIAVELKEVAE